LAVYPCIYVLCLFDWRAVRYRVFDAMDTCAAHSTNGMGTLGGTYLAEDSPTTAVAVADDNNSSSSDEWETTNDAMGQSCEIVDLDNSSCSQARAPEQGFAISLRDVHFAYKSRPEKEVLRGISLRIPDKTLTVIVGKNGAGKSTLHKLMCGLYPPTRGQIAINNKCTRSDDLEWIRSQASELIVALSL
jgi:ABC-type multidrug transport system fused ATPase/permease subunit